MDLETAKRVHRRTVRKVGAGTYNRDRDGELWDEAQAVIDREIRAPERERARLFEQERIRLFSDPATGLPPGARR